MTTSGRPVRTTVLFGLLSAGASVPAVWALDLVLPGPMALRLTVWLALALYGLLLSRWAGRGVAGIAFPLLLLLVCALAGVPSALFLVLAAAVLSWVRSGVCFPGPLFRTLAAELLVSLGGGALVLSLDPHSALTWALGFWLFFLVQALYFVPFAGAADGDADPGPRDPFEEAMQRAERILADGP